MLSISSAFATPGFTFGGSPSCFPTQSAACASLSTITGRPYQWNSGIERCLNSQNGGDYLALNGCNLPSCRADQELDAGGQCVCPSGKSDVGGVCVTSCPVGYHNKVPDDGQCVKDCAAAQKLASDGSCTCDAKSFVTSASHPALDSRCVGGCSISWSAGLASMVDTAKYLAKQIPLSGVSVTAFVRQSGVVCEAAPNFVNVTLPPLAQDTSGKAADGVTPDPLNKPETNQSPEACAGVGGSYGVFNGVTKCLTDKGNSMQKLTVDSSVSNKTNPDGSSSTTTKQKFAFKDPVTGEIKSRTESTTVEKNASGVVTGTSGTSAEANGRQSDLCANNPGLQICKGGLNEEITQKRVADALTVDTADYTDITNADQNAAMAQAKQNALDATSDAISDMSKFGTSSDPAAIYHQQVEAALTNWFDPIPASTCAPVGGTIGGRSFSIDICPTAAKISEIGAYALWVMFAFGIFVMVTRKAE